MAEDETADTERPDEERSEEEAQRQDWQGHEYAEKLRAELVSIGAAQLGFLLAVCGESTDPKVQVATREVYAVSRQLSLLGGRLPWEQ